MDESLKQQILAVDLLRPHSIYFSNCSYLLRKKKKKRKKVNLILITQLLIFSLLFTSLGWDAGSHHLSSLLRGGTDGIDPWLLQGKVLIAEWWSF